MEQVLKLDAECEEAVNELLYCKVQQLVVNDRSLSHEKQLQECCAQNIFRNISPKSYFLLMF